MDLNFIVTTLSISAAIAVTTALLGVFVAKNLQKHDYFLSFFISIGTGLLVGIALTEFLPLTFTSQTNVSIAALMVLAGIIFVIAMEKFIIPRLFGLMPDTGHTHSHDEHKYCVHTHSHTHETHISYATACMSIGCVIVCSFFDGLEISAAFYMNHQTGWLTSLGFLLHSVSNGALGASLGLSGGFSSKQSLRTACLIGFLLFLGSAVGVFGLYAFSFETYFLPFSTGVMLYIAFTHLIPLAVKDKTGWLGFAIGSALAFMTHALHLHY